MSRLASARTWLLAGAVGSFAAVANAQMTDPARDVRLGQLRYYGGKPPVADDPIFVHAILDQAEGRFTGRNLAGRWEGQAWAGTDYNKIWIKSEGLLSSKGKIEDGQNQLLYARSVSPFFDLQAGLRVDANSSTTSRSWGAFGFQGLSMYFFDLEVTGFVSDRGALAARLAASYDLLVTQRLILQPQIEMNVYSQATPGLVYGAGFSSMEAGLRLRYEITRKFAPYIGIHYEGKFGQTATLVRQNGEKPSSIGLVFGIRSWF